jgi:uncharacterized protein YndB with AHSA1/START domain
MATQTLTHRLDRSVLIQAPRDVVFSYFTDNTRWARWWGQGSTIDARAGGTVLIVHPGGVRVSGEILEIDAPSRLVFTYGYESGTPIPPGSSVVTFRLDEDRHGTRLNLSHAFADEQARDQHVQGWRYQFAVFGNLVADDTHADAGTAVDGWFTAWSEPDAAKREAMLDRLATEDVRFKDRFSLVDGMSDLRPHLAAVHVFMPGMRIEREGDVRHCQGTVLADWVARGADGQERGRGTHVFALAHSGRIEAVTGFWNPPKKTT